MVWVAKDVKSKFVATILSAHIILLYTVVICLQVCHAV